MRLHVRLDDAIVADIDARTGRGRRSAFIAEALRRALDEPERWDEVEAALGAIPDSGHDWDDSPAAWVRSQRRTQASGL
jgi:Arc/MetJ-type ribon-helix-helix transcriptional regulator